MADDPPWLLRITVTDDGSAMTADLESRTMPAYKHRAALQAALACLQESEAEMHEQVAIARAKRKPL